MASPAILERLQAEFDSPPDHIAAAVALLAQGAPPAFVARHRRPATGNMPEERLLAIAERLHFLEELEQRKQSILQQTSERGRPTADLEALLAGCQDQDLLDDLDHALRPRRRTQAMLMEEKGLGPLALAIQHRQLGDRDLRAIATEYMNEANGLPTVEAVLEGALWILAERIAHDPLTRARCRDELRRGILRARAVNPDQGRSEEYQQFFDFAEPIHRIGSQRMLALRRAEREGILHLELGLEAERHRDVLRPLHAADLPAGSTLRDYYDLVFDHAWRHGLQEACGRDVRRRLKEKADREAVRTHARNLRSQLLAPPLGHKRVLSLRTSGKVIWIALLGEDGSVLQHKALQCADDAQREQALAELATLVQEQQPAAIAVPHGRRQAGSEKVVAELRARVGADKLPMVVPVDEAASAIYATSPDGRKAVPGVEVGVRAAISLGRRLQDPLRELVHMEFRALGLGHTVDDVHQGMLQRELAAVVNSCIAAVGIDLNTASADLLARMPGLNAELAKAIVDHRRRIGGFQRRSQLAEVPGLSADACRWVAPFLFIEGGSEPLDRTIVQPDDYLLATAIAQQLGQPVEQLFGADLRQVNLDAFVGPDVDRARVLGVLQALRFAGKDPRGELTPTVNTGVNSIADLRPDQELRGRVANLTEFGAFVDLGIGQDGLIHVSQIPAHRLRDPQQMLRVGEVVQVWLLHVDAEARKISLTMHKPRHLAEGRQPTIGERLERGPRTRGPRGPRREQRPAQPAFSRAARTPESRRGRHRQPPLTLDGKPEAAHEGEAAAGSPRPGHGGERPERGDRRDDRRSGRRPDRRDIHAGPPRGRGDRVITVESAMAVPETKGHRGELTSLASLRSLLSRVPATDATGRPEQPASPVQDQDAVPAPPSPPPVVAPPAPNDPAPDPA